MKRTTFLITLLLLFFVGEQIKAQSNSSDAITGVWYNEEKTARIRIYEEEGKYYGKIIWLEEPIDPETGKPKVDNENPEEDLRSRPVKGLAILEGFVYEGDNEYTEGTIYDPNNGKTYKCKMTLVENDLLDVRGYVGYSWMGLGRTTEWTRYKED